MASKLLRFEAISLAARDLTPASDGALPLFSTELILAPGSLGWDSAGSADGSFRQGKSKLEDLCVLKAGGGPDLVSMPWLLLEAGGRLEGGERGSRIADPGCRAKYDVGLDSVCGSGDVEMGSEGLYLRARGVWCWKSEEVELSSLASSKGGVGVERDLCCD